MAAVGALQHGGDLSNLPLANVTPAGAAGAAAPKPPPPPADPVGELIRQVAQLSAATRELLGATREMLAVNRDQLELLKRAEQRAEEQRQAQREEFTRFLNEHRRLKGRCKQAEATVRGVLGRAITDLVEYVDDHEEDLAESDFVRSELTDRYGSMLHSLFTSYGVLKHLSAADQALTKPPGGPPPTP